MSVSVQMRFFALMLATAAATHPGDNVQTREFAPARQLASEGFNLTVKSANYDSGNLAEFYVDGSKLDVPTSRGMNMVVLNFDGSVKSTNTFDTHGSGSEALVNFVNDLEEGTPVLMAIMDEAQGNLSSAAKEAIKSLGAANILSLQYRESYALIGIKDGAALAEQIMADKGPVATASAMYKPVSNTKNVTVRSASFFSGNLAEFYVDGAQLKVATSRGMNMVVLNYDGSLKSSNTFDTHGSGSEALVDFVNGLGQGSLVLLAIQDEARGNLSVAAKNAIRSLGATRIDSLVYRDSYALIGIKGGAALSEQIMPNEGPVAVASALYSASDSKLTTTSTTTVLLESCAMFMCPQGFTLRPEADSLIAATINASTTCCRNAADPSLADVGVHSAGWCKQPCNGNEAVFFVGGKPIFSANGRGLTVVTLRPDGTRQTSEAFDTMRAGSDALAAHINSLEDGTLVMVGAKDEAASNLTIVAKSALKTCGAEKIDSLRFRGGYALIGVKGGKALAEEVKAEGEGFAIAVTQKEIVISAGGYLPVCEARVPRPLVAGYVADGNLKLEADCRYNIYERKGARTCLGGAWVVLTGSSNTLLEFGNLVNFLAPDEYSIEREGESIGASAVVDVVIEDGKVVHWGTVANSLGRSGIVCRQVNMNEVDKHDAECRQIIKDKLAEAPAYRATATRITIFVSFFWHRTGVALDIIGANTAWAAAEVAWITQVGAWYNVCAIVQNDYCPRKELLTMDRDEAIGEFNKEMEGVMVKMDSFCKPGGRAGQRGCNIQTISWTNGKGDNDNFKIMNALLIEAMQPRQSDTFRLVDFFNLGGAMPEEVVNGHGSQMLNLWVWQIMLNAMCPAELASKGSYAAWEGKICSGTDARWENCPEYFKNSCDPDKPASRCEKWECMNSVPCTMTAEEPPQQDEIVKGSMGLVVPNCATFTATPSAKESIEEGIASAVGVWKRKVSSTLQCGNDSNSRRLAAGQGLLVKYEIVIPPTNVAVTATSVATAMVNLSAPAMADLIHGALVTNGLGNVSVDVEYLSRVTIPARYFVCAAPVHTTNFTNSSLLHAAAAEQAQSHQDPCYNAQGLRRRLWCQDDFEWLLPVVFSLLAILMVFGPTAWARFRPQQAKQASPEAPIIPASLVLAASKVVETEKSPRTLVLLPSTQPLTLLAQSHAPSRKSFCSEPASPACTSANISVDGCQVSQPDDREEDEPGSKKAEKQEVMKPEEPGAQEASMPCGRGQNQDESKNAEEDSSRNTIVAVAEETKAIARTGDMTKQEGNLKSIDARENLFAESKLVEKQQVAMPAVAETPVTAAKEAIAKKPAFKAAGNKFPLGLARFLASCHVVVGHLYAKGVTAPVKLFGWGFTWVPWFFMLSGFVLFSAYLKNPKEETMFQYVMRRSVTIYPLYAFSLIPAFAIQKGLGTLQASADTLVAQSFLLQAWVPLWTESALQMHCWFLSCMVVYWFFFKPLSYLLKNLSLLKTILLMAFLFFLPWLTIIVPAIAGEKQNWYSEHGFLKTDTALDIGVVMLKFHPVCYIHVFVLGMLLAKLRRHLDAKAIKAGPADSWRNPWRVAIQFIAPLGYLMLLLVFAVEEFQPKMWGYKISSRISVLLPFQAMVLFGLAGLPSLPLPFFSLIFSQLDFLEKYSYGVYVFQFLCYSMWPQTGEVNLPLFMIFCIAFSIVISCTVKMWVEKWWATHSKGRLAVPFVLAALLGGLSCLPDPTPTAADSSLSDIPAFVKHDDSMLDMRLGLIDPEGRKQQAWLMNPSLLIHGNEVVVVARRHRQENVRSIGQSPVDGGQVTLLEEIWHSDIVLGTTALDSEAWGNWPRTGIDPLASTTLRKWTGLQTSTGRPWGRLCSKEDSRWMEKNRTLIRQIVTGPEDPKPLLVNGEIVVTFDSRPPAEQSSCRVDKEGYGNAVTQMYLANGVRAGEPQTLAVGHRLDYGQEDVAEKNWVGFVHERKLRYVYAPSPHKIVAAQMNGSSEQLASTKFKPLQDLQTANPNMEVRGSGQAVWVDDPDRTPRLPNPHYLALFHIYDKATRQYAHHAYRFSSSEPFQMMQVSSPLPLTQAESEMGGVPFAFASGLAVHNGTVVISYGAGDRDARALVLTLERLDQMFNCSDELK